ncbi:hypothetical protein AVEN_226128-1, partial [Araneus ventricosus]
MIAAGLRQQPGQLSCGLNIVGNYRLTLTIAVLQTGGTVRTGIDYRLLLDLTG